MSQTIISKGQNLHPMSPFKVPDIEDVTIYVSGAFFFSPGKQDKVTHTIVFLTHTHTHKNEAKYLTNMRKSSVHFPASSNFTSPNHEWMLDWLRCAVCEKSVTAGLRHMNGIQSH